MCAANGLDHSSPTFNNRNNDICSNCNDSINNNNDENKIKIIVSDLIVIMMY